VNEGALGQFIPPLLRFFRVNVISPMLHNHLHLNIAIILRTRGKSLGILKVLPDIGKYWTEN
jgi:hypothetical protein